MSVVTGSLDLLVRLRVRDHTHLRQLLLAKIFQITGVQRTETFLSIADIDPDNFTAALLEDMIQQRDLVPHLTGGSTPVSTSNPSHGISGVGQHGFVARHGLYSAEQQAAADEVAARIRELGLSTVRLVVVDQHGVPRSKSLSAEVAIAAMSNGLDFSGAIYSLDSGNQVFVPAFAAGGGFGIDELTGFPDVVLVPDPSTFRVLPWADRTGWMLCDVYFSSGAPMPLDGRGLMRRALSALGEAGYDYLAGIEIEYYIVKVDSDRIEPGERRVHPGPAGRQRLPARLPVPVRGAAGQRLRDAGGDPRRPERGRAAAEVDGGRVGPRPDGVQLQPDRRAGGGRRGGAVPFRGQADVPAPRAAGDVHVPAGAAELLLLRLAPARVADLPGRRAQRVR